MTRYSFAFLCTALGGCAGVPSSLDLTPPPARCMIAPASLQVLKEGDDLVPVYASALRSYGREASKLKCTQRWIKTVLNKGG